MLSTHALSEHAPKCTSECKNLETALIQTACIPFVRSFKWLLWIKLQAQRTVHVRDQCQRLANQELKPEEFGLCHPWVYCHQLIHWRCYLNFQIVLIFSLFSKLTSHCPIYQFMQALQSLNLTLGNTKLHTSSHCEIFQSTVTIQLEVDLSHTHSILMTSSKSTAEVIHFHTLFF